MAISSLQEPPPKECKEAHQLKRCTEEFKDEAKCIRIVAESEKEAVLYNRRMIKQAIKAKRAALERRLNFIELEIAKYIKVFNVFKDTFEDAPSSGQYAPQ